MQTAQIQQQGITELRQASESQRQDSRELRQSITELRQSSEAELRNITELRQASESQRQDSRELRQSIIELRQASEVQREAQRQDSSELRQSIIELRQASEALQQMFSELRANQAMLQAEQAELARERHHIFGIIAQQQSDIRGMQTENRRMIDILLNQREQDDDEQFN